MDTEAMVKEYFEHMDAFDKLVEDMDAYLGSIMLVKAASTLSHLEKHARKMQVIRDLLAPVAPPEWRAKLTETCGVNDIVLAGYRKKIPAELRRSR